MKKLKKLLAVSLVAASMAFGASAADDIVYNFDSAAGMTGWSTQLMRYNFEPGYFNGYAYERSANLSDPYFMSPVIDINAEDYRYIVVNMRYSLDATWKMSGDVFFLVPDGTWNQANSVNSGNFANATEWDFVDIVFDMTKNEAWKGQIKQIRVDPFDVPGTIAVKSITLTNTLPEPKVEEKEEDKPTTGEEPKKQVGVFLKPNTYADNFADVLSTEWYAKEVASAYELGIIGGKSATVFDPAGGMTVAEAITMAARTRNAYGSADYDFSVKDGEEWFAPYVNYAVANGIIGADTFTDYNKPITRGEMALVFANVLPSSEYTYINSVTAIPDVPVSSPYYNSVYKLYNAGIAMGGDAAGTFRPDTGIIRAEAAAIINRVALKENRVSKNLVMNVPATDRDMFVMSSEAKYLMDDEKFMNTIRGGVPSAWDVVKVYDTPSKETRPSNIIADTSEEQEAYFKRNIFDVKDGVLDLQFGARIYGSTGAYVSFVDTDGNPVMEIMLDGGKFKVLSADGSYTDTGITLNTNDVHYNVHVNLDRRTFDLGINGIYGGTYPLSSANTVSEFRFGTTKKGYITITADYAFLYHNFLMHEKFVNAPNNILPYHINTISDGGKVEKYAADAQSAKYANGGYVALKSNANGTTGIHGNFEKATGNVVFETYVLLPDETNGAKIAITSNGNDVFYLTTADGNFVAPNGAAVKYVTKNLWHIIRFEADTATGKALVKINGKDVGTYDFANTASFIDGYKVTYTPNAASAMYVDDISAFVKLPYPEDYVPEPVIPNGDDYFVGLNVCSMWREGSHYGWDEISAYPEITPVLGYYDEGNPEVSDWEIKMMTEHGIDYQIFCWYPDGNITAPVQHSNMNSAIIDGYFNARYSDKMQFAIMWENYNTSGMSLQDFKDYTIPYWIEYFFKDDRYVKIDNKPLFTIWQTDNKFGDCSFKEAMDALREACKEAGFAGCEILLYSSNTDPAYEATLESLGIDGILAYHWGTDGANADKQAANLTAYGALDYTIPTISVGFDNVGWGMTNQVRNGLLDPADYPKLAEIVKSTVHTRKASGAKYANMVNISTWNEYGEGTYVMPTERFGFGYLDAIRTAFTKNNTKHSDLTLTDAQRQRINYLFDQDRQLLRPQILEKAEATEKVDPYAGAEVIKKFTFENETLDSFTYWGGDDTKIENGIVSYKPTIKDPVFFWKNSFEPISAEKANVIRIRAKITSDTESVATLFFKTDDGKDFAQDKAVTAKHVLGEWNDYYFDFRENVHWKDNIINLRIDLTEYTSDLVEMESVEFLYIPMEAATGPFTVDIIGAKLDLIKEPDRTGGGLMTVLFPESGMLSRMKSTYTWDKNTKLLTITNGEHTFSVTIGTDEAVIDGKATKLYAKTYMYDGLPVIPLDTLATALGYFPVYHENGGGVSIMLESAADYDIIKNREKGKYEFNLDGDVEDWTEQMVTIETKGGNLVATATGGDPAIGSPELYLKAEKYPTIVVRMKWDRDSDKNDYACIYFRTANTGLSDTRRVDIPLEKSSGGEFVELRFDMTKSLQWYGDIPSIRFDPFNSTGSFEIDYIRFEEDPFVAMSEALQKEWKENLSDTIVNGDAEISYFNTMTSSNAEVTIVERHEGGNFCYDVKSNGGQNWTYFMHKVKFEPGATYVVEFDARMTGTNAGDTTPGISTGIYINAQYDGTDTRDHTAAVTGGALVMSDKIEWTHFKGEISIDEKCNNVNDIISIFTDPIDGGGASYQIDNFTMTKKK